MEEGGFEPPKSTTTDLQSAPFGHSGTPPYEIGAGGRIRTPDLLITNQLLYQLSYTSVSDCLARPQRRLFYQSGGDLSTGFIRKRTTFFMEARYEQNKGNGVPFQGPAAGAAGGLLPALRRRALRLGALAPIPDRRAPVSRVRRRAREERGVYHIS